MGKITHSGSKDAVCFKLEIDMVASATDKNIPQVSIKPFGFVQFFSSDEVIESADELFRGYVFNNKLSPYSNIRQVVCYDGGYFLANSKAAYNFRQQTPEAVTEKVCTDHGVDVGELIPGDPYDRIHDEDTLYDIIQTGYTILSHKTGEQYMQRMNKGKLEVVKKGDIVSEFMLTGKTDITGLEYEEDATGVVNRVKVYDEQRNEVGMVELEGDYSGILQDVYQSENGDQSGAKGLLREVRQVISGFEAFGKPDCITGNAVVVHDEYTGLSGLFYIDAHTHTWENGTYMMTLDLAFENVMDQVEAGKEKEEKATAGSGGAGYHGIPNDSVEAEMWNVLRSLGYSQAAAAAMIANAKYESEFNTSAVESGNTGNGRGLFQWDVRNRWQEHIKWSNSQGLDPYSVEAQVRFADYEMKTQAWLMSGVGGYEAFKNATSVAEANRMFYHGFERPAWNPSNYALRESAAVGYHDSLSALEAQHAPKVVSDGKWTFPTMSGAPVTPGSDYNNYRSWDPYYGGYHKGIDFAAAQGSPIYAASSGTVITAGWENSYGNTIVIDHGNGLTSRYAHIMPGGLYVNVGDTVSAGQNIAGVGNTGDSHGAHLHFEMKHNGQHINPWDYIR